MLEAVELFRDRDTVDELGLGSVRDAFSDLLFPGTSVLHTRARYLLFIPWIYLDLERRTVGSAQAGAAGRRAEVRLIAALRRGDPDAQGIIGGRVGERVQRLPSTAYWQGLHRLGLRIHPGSQDRYHRSLDAFYVERRRFNDLRRAVHGDESELDEREPSNWHRSIPPAPDGVFETTSFTLEPFEAEYLRDRILLQASGTMFAALVEKPTVVAGVEHSWLHPACESLEPELRERVRYAHLFSDLMHGAQLLYGYMVGELISPDASAPYEDALSRWERNRDQLARRVRAVDRERFWDVVRAGNPRVGHPTHRFINQWWDIVLADDGVAGSSQARSLIGGRELFLKRGLARLDPANLRARELWGGGGGLNQLDYRWPTVRQLLGDIHTGLADARS